MQRLTSRQRNHRLDEDTAIWNGDVKAATKVRKIEKAGYALHKDCLESFDASERAIAVLRKQNYDRKQKAPEKEEAFPQVSA